MNRYLSYVAAWVIFITMMFFSIVGVIITLAIPVLTFTALIKYVSS